MSPPTLEINVIETDFGRLSMPEIRNEKISLINDCENAGNCLLCL